MDCINLIRTSLRVQCSAETATVLLHAGHDCESVPEALSAPVSQPCVRLSDTASSVRVLCAAAEKPVFPWPQGGNDNQHSGRSRLLSAQRGAQQWTVTVGQYNMLLPAPPVLGINNTLLVPVYVPDGFGNTYLYALDSLSGALKWRFSSTGAFPSSATVGPDGTIYVGNYLPALHALSPSGVQLWNFTKLQGALYSSPVLGSDGVLYFGSMGSVFYAVRAKDGELLWTLPVNITYNTPALSLDGKFAYLTSSYGRSVIAVDISGRSVAWLYGQCNGIFNGAVVGPNGAVYVGSNDGNVYALAGTTGALLWSRTCNGWMYASPSVGADGTVYASAENGNLFALDGGTGAVKWNSSGFAYTSSGVIAGDGTLYYCSIGGVLYAMSSGTGAVKWSAKTAMCNGLAIGPGNALYTASYDGSARLFV